MDWLFQQSQQKPYHKFINGWTFGAVYHAVQHLKEKLRQVLQQEQRVAILAYNSVDTVFFILALQELGIEVLMLNTRLTDEEISKQLMALSIRTVLTDHREGFVSFETVKKLDSARHAGEKIADVPIQDSHISILMNTSASSGQFKTVPLRRSQLLAHVRASAQRLGVTEADNWLLVLPLYHVGGMMILFRSLFNGTQVTLVDKFEEAYVLDLIHTGAVNMLSLVPTMLLRLVDHIREHHLRVVLLGGDFIPGVLAQKCVEKQIPLYKTYGMTETTSQATSFSVLEYPDKIHSVGRSLEGFDIQIYAPDASGVGEIIIKGPAVLSGYLGQAPIHGYLHTEDMGYLDADNFLYLLDRRQNMMISGGENIYPKEIEDILYAHPRVKECAVVGKADAYWGKVPVLYVVSDLSQAEILSYLSTQLAKYKIPREVFFLDALPKDATGKILKKALLARLQEDTGQWERVQE